MFVISVITCDGNQDEVVASVEKKNNNFNLNFQAFVC